MESRAPVYGNYRARLANGGILHRMIDILWREGYSLGLAGYSLANTQRMLVILGRKVIGIVCATLPPRALGRVAWKSYRKPLKSLKTAMKNITGAMA
jgi:hypothetical protein